MPPKPRPSRTADAKNAAQLYGQGRTIRQIAEQFGLSYGGAYNLVRDGGATMRPRGKPTKPSR